MALGNVKHLEKWEIIPMHIYPCTLGSKSLFCSLFTSPLEFWSFKEQNRRQEDYDEDMFKYGYC